VFGSWKAGIHADPILGAFETSVDCFYENAESVYAVFRNASMQVEEFTFDYTPASYAM